ncbi:MAG: DUF6326 family protein [Bacteroidales bacterium]
MIKLDIKIRLSTLWIVVLINMIFADIFSIMVELVNGNSLNIPGNVRVIMAIAAVVTNIPIMMIYLSRVLKYKSNRIANIVAAILTIIYVIGGGDSAPHYLIIAAIEILFLIMIIVYSVKWKNEKNK